MGAGGAALETAAGTAAAAVSATHAVSRCRDVVSCCIKAVGGADGVDEVAATDSQSAQCCAGGWIEFSGTDTGRVLAEYKCLTWGHSTRAQMAAEQHQAAPISRQHRYQGSTRRHPPAVCRGAESASEGAAGPQGHSKLLTEKKGLRSVAQGGSLQTASAPEGAGMFEARCCLHQGTQQLKVDDAMTTIAKRKAVQQPKALLQHM